MIWEDIKFKTNGFFCIKLSNKFFVSRCIPYIYIYDLGASISIYPCSLFMVGHQGPPSSLTTYCSVFQGCIILEGFNRVPGCLL